MRFLDRIRNGWRNATLTHDAGIDWALDPEQPDMPADDVTAGMCHGCGKGTYRVVYLWPENCTVHECAACRP